MRKDTTAPEVLALARPLAGLGSGDPALDLAARLRVIPVGFYHAVVGQAWSSDGRAETDQLHHLNITVAGQATIWHGERRYDLRPGTADWFPGNTPVRRECHDSYECYYLTFRCEWIDGIDLLTEWPERGPLSLGPWDVPAWRPAWEHQPMTPNTLVQTVAECTARLVQALPDLTDLIDRHARAAQLFPRVFAYLTERANAGAGMVSVTDLAAVHGATPGAFAKAFTRSMGISPKVFLQRRTYQEACTLLRATDLPIKAIAARLGFEDAFYFTRWFSRFNGLPPGRFRSGN